VWLRRCAHCMVRAWLAVGQRLTVRRAAQVEEHRAGRAAQLADKQRLAQQLQVPEHKLCMSKHANLKREPASLWGAVFTASWFQATL
jgi:hypothetical protein